MGWIVNNKNMLLTSNNETFNANIKAVVGVGDCVNATSGTNEYANAQNAWSILDSNNITFTTPVCENVSEIFREGRLAAAAAAGNPHADGFGDFGAAEYIATGPFQSVSTPGANAS